MAKDPKTGKPYRRRFSNYLLDRSLQLRYITVVTLLSAVISAILGYMIWQQENRSTEQVMRMIAEVECEGQAIENCEEYEQIRGNLTERDTNLVLTMAGVGVGLVIVLVLYLLIMTHKVAGPLYKVSRYFNRMAEGKLGETYPLRRGDMLQDFYDRFQEMHQDVRERLLADNELSSKFLQACADAGVEREGELGTALDRLEDHHRSRKEALS